MKNAEAKILIVDNLSLAFGVIKALNKVNFEVEKGKITALIGPNGAGKTTVFNCLTGFYRADQGSLLFNSRGSPVDLSELVGKKFSFKLLLDLPHLFRRLFYKMFGGTHLVTRSGLARTFQNIRLFRDMTVLENLLVAQHTKYRSGIIGAFLGLPRFKHENESILSNAKFWLEQLDLLDDANKLAGSLSYGQQRKLEIARAMCCSPALLCLDEPAAGLNPQETIELGILIKKLVADFQISVLIIEHDMSLVMNISDAVVVLNYGEVIAKGSPAEIKADTKVLAAYLGSEAV